MELWKAKIVGDDSTIRVLSGRIVEIFKDRRGSDLAPIRFGNAAQRRRLPEDLEKLVGSGRLWVVKGTFEILESQTKNWKPSAMHLVSDDLEMRIVRLQPTTSAATTRLNVKTLKVNPDTKTWTFSALFEPTTAQIDKLIHTITDKDSGLPNW